MKEREITIRGTFERVRHDDDDSLPYLIYSYVGRGTSGRTRTITSIVKIREQADLQRLETDFREGDQIEITIRTDTSDHKLPCYLLNFTNLSRPASA
jgi:hypothetical protein